MATISIKALLESGAHFGHRTQRWNPKMAPYIFGARNGIYILDLLQTQKLAQAAYDHVRDVVAAGESVLFVCTKRQAAQVVEEEAQRCGMFHVTNRWLGGTLTNFQTIRNSIRRLNRLEEIVNAEPDQTGLTKKERGRIQKERDKLQKNLGGFREMGRLPGAIFIVDTLRENIAVAEAQRLGISSIALVDTNCDPENVDYPIPANDDALRTIKLFAGYLADAVLEARAERSEGAEVPPPQSAGPAVAAAVAAEQAPAPSPAEGPAPEAPAAPETPAPGAAQAPAAPTPEASAAEPAPAPGAPPAEMTKAEQPEQEAARSSASTD